MTKRFLTYEQQIKKLESKNIIINDYNFAIDCLKEISYFSLITGYKGVFRNKNTKKYKDNTKFEDIYYLYKLDEELRNLFLKYILKIEKTIKSHYSYFFCEKFGESQKEYLNVNNFDYDNFQLKVNSLVLSLDKELNSDKYDFIVHNRKSHKNVPFWVLINTLTFGTISKIYKYSKTSIKINVAKEFNIRYEELISMLGVITKFRNVCAHNERLYNYNTKQNCIRDLPIHKAPKFKGKGKNDLFSITICFKYLLKENDFKTFFKQLNYILQEYNNNSGNLNETLECMGFPNNWYDIINL